MRTPSIVVLAIAVVACMANTTLAQDEADAAPQTTQPNDDTGAAGAADEVEPRFRWGITGGGGSLMGDYTGGGAGFDARFGVQLDPMLAVYAQPSVFLFVGAKADLEGAELTAGAVYGLGVLGDITLGDIFFLAAGPELLNGAIGSSSTTVRADGTTATAKAAEGMFFSVAARTGFVFGSKRPDRRSGFSLGLDMHAVFANGDLAVPVMVFLGYERF